MRYRVDGVSTPVGGIQWEKYTTEKDRIRYLFFYLESKRILINPTDMEFPDQCIKSVLDIKNNLVQITYDIEFSSRNIETLRELVTACNQYLDMLNKLNLPHLLYKNDGTWVDIKYDAAIRNLRDIFRQSITKLEEINDLKSSVKINH